MSSWYDPPEEGPGAIAGPDWWVTTYQDNERDEEIITTLDQMDLPTTTQTIKKLTKDGYEVFIRYGYAWAMEEDDTEWLFADSYEDAQGEIGDRYLQEIEDAKHD
tara:strand:+ start:480 stop:794 length:315 start_codon:yes stop_codon:yes gene_type:complete